MLKKPILAPRTSGRDWVDPSEAVVLAAMISEYWAKRGYDVKMRLEHLAQGKMHGSQGAGIRSDMVGGFPVRKRKKVMA